MTLEQLFDRKRTRNIFFISIFTLVAFFFVLRYVVFPKWEPSLSQGWLPFWAKMMEDLSTTILVTLFVAAFLWWITPPRVRKPGITIVEPREFDHHFSEALLASNSWRFSGGCGRYFRDAVLESMKKRARNSSTSKSVDAVIMNPVNDNLCAQYARYRAGTGRGRKEGGWTSVKVKQELLATILIAKKYANDESLVDVGIYVSDYFSGFRIDISEACALQTREDAAAPALRWDHGSYYYEALVDEYRLRRDQSRELVGAKLECASVCCLSTLKIALDVLGLAGHGLSDSELEKVLMLTVSPVNPYE